LQRVAIFVSDGSPCCGSTGSKQTTKAEEWAGKIKAELDGVIMSVGFAGASVTLMKKMDGNKHDDPYGAPSNPSKACGDECFMFSSALSDAKDKLLTDFCTIVISMIPPTPKPTLDPCGHPVQVGNNDKDGNKDMPWASCEFDMCNMFPWGNGSSEGCVAYRNKGWCNDMLHECRCTCQEDYVEATHKGAGRCCTTASPTKAPTKYPTPRPGEPTSSPTNKPTQNPTLQLPNQPTFNFFFAGLQDWKAAEDILKAWFLQLGYDFDTDWKKMVDEGRVKYKKEGSSETIKFQTSSLFTVPFQPFEMLVWMPDKFYMTTSIKISGATNIVQLSSVLLLLVALIARA